MINIDHRLRAYCSDKLTARIEGSKKAPETSRESFTSADARDERKSKDEMEDRNMIWRQVRLAKIL
jgi:hypothetical protein